MLLITTTRRYGGRSYIARSTRIPMRKRNSPTDVAEGGEEVEEAGGTENARGRVRTIHDELLGPRDIAGDISPMT